MKVGLIGLGAMGAPIAGHLAEAGLLKVVWNRSLRRAQDFVEVNPEVVRSESPALLARIVDIIVTCVSADDDLRAVVNAMQPVLRSGQILVDHSTVAPQTAIQISDELAALEVAFVDAPVTGGVEGAKNGQLAIMAGGEAEVLQSVSAMFESYGKLWRHLGPVGAGQSAKAINQLMVAGIAEAVCESLALVERLGLPQEDMLNLLGSGAAGNWFLDKRGRTMLNDSFETGFEPRLLLKDLRICEALAERHNFRSSVLPAAIHDYQQLIAQGESGKDISALIRRKRKT